MSKLIDKLSKMSRSRPTPMGFRASAAPHPTPLLLIGRLSHVGKEMQESLNTANLDAFILEPGSQGSDVQALSKLSKAFPDVPCGAFWAKGTAEDGASLANAGADFVVADPATTPAAILAEKRLGHVLAVDQSLTDGMIAAAEGLGANAALLRPGFEDSPSLTVGDLLTCQRVYRLLRKPLLVSISLDLKTPDLQALVGTGIKGVIVKISDKETARRAAEMKNVLGTLTAMTKDSEAVVVPTVSTAEPPPAQETEEP